MTLQEAKDALSARLLGRLGIHGVGRRSKDEAVVLYFDQGTETRVIDAAIVEAREIVRPYRVLFEIEQSPRFQSS
jgi:hypothetical protein